MCNAWNHPPDCTCGFRGGGHIGRRGSTDSNSNARYESANPNIFFPLSSYLNPNATCPACGAQVFFYQSPNGGKVFFDELGPPWPKHPCTDLSSRPTDIRINNHPATETDQSAAQHNYSWQKEGWKPFICSIDKIDYRVCRFNITLYVPLSFLTLYVPLSSLTLYVPLSSLSTSTLFQIRPDNKRLDVYQISIMQFNAGSQSKEPITHTTSAFLRVQEAYTYHQKNHRPHSTVNNRTKDNSQSGRREVAKTSRSPTAIGLAFAHERNKQSAEYRSLERKRESELEAVRSKVVSCQGCGKKQVRFDRTTLLLSKKGLVWNCPSCKAVISPPQT